MLMVQKLRERDIQRRNIDHIKFSHHRLFPTPFSQRHEDEE